jgi:hypothetical protein
MRFSLAIAMVVLGGVCGVTTRAIANEPLPIYPATAGGTPADREEHAPRPRFDQRPLSVWQRIGAAASTGLVGMVLEYNLHDRLALNVGIGTNLLGLSSAVGARVRPLVVASSNHEQLHALTFESSLSRSAYRGDGPGGILCDDGCMRSEYVAWAQTEVGWEARFGRHWQVQTSLGAAYLLGNPQFSCVNSQHDPARCASPRAPDLRVLFSQTLGVGYAF